MDETNKTIKKRVIIRKKKNTLKFSKSKNSENEVKEKSQEEKEKESNQLKENKNNYLTHLSEKEKKALEIAKDHLKTSFDLEKSIDYINWNNKK